MLEDFSLSCYSLGGFFGYTSISFKLKVDVTEARVLELTFCERS
jgi:hypothetical protein